MSVKRRGKVYHLQIRLFGRQIMVRTSADNVTEAKHIERAVLSAVRSGDYRSLDPKSRETALRIFSNQRWETPSDMGTFVEAKKELTLWEAVELFLNYPTVRDSKGKERHIYALTNIVEHFGKERPVKSIWVRDIHEYAAFRLRRGVKEGTVNREKSTLSRLFSVMIELRLLESNPARLVKRLPTKSGERQAYLSLQDVQRIVDLGPRWFGPLIMTLYYTGMRRSEVLSLTRNRVNPSRRIIRLGPEHTKEGHWKRVPIHRDLVPVLEEALRVTSIDTGRVFLIADGKGVRPPSPESVKNPWLRAVKKMKLNPRPTVHDLQHTWKTNARRSGMDPEIREMILGHSTRERSVTERYGRISDQELIDAIDRVTFDHGPTEIWVAGASGV